MMTQLINNNKTASVSRKNNITVLCFTSLAWCEDGDNDNDDDDDSDNLFKTRLSASPKTMAKKITPAKLASLNDAKMLAVMSFSNTPSYTCVITM